MRLLIPTLLVLATSAAAAPPQASQRVITGGTPVDQVAISPRNPDRILALYLVQGGSPDPGIPLIVRSLDGGDTFDVLVRTAGIFGDERVNQVAFSGSGVVWVTTPGGLYRSGDLGSTFEVVLTPGPGWFGTDGRIDRLFFDPFDPEHLWLDAGYENTLGGSIMRSQDGGDTWSPVAPIAKDFWWGTEDVLFDTALEGRILVSQGGQLFRSDDAGSTWSLSGSPWNQNALRRSVLRDGLMYRSIAGDRLGVSSDDGQTFTEVPGLPAMESSIAVHPIDRDRWAYLGPDVRVVSDDGGQTWGVTPNGQYDGSREILFVPAAPEPDVFDSEVLIASIKGIARVALDEPLGFGLALPASERPRPTGIELVFDVRDSSRILNQGRLSEDGGRTWRSVPVPTALGPQPSGITFPEFLFTPSGDILWTLGMRNGVLATIDGAGAVTTESVAPLNHSHIHVAPHDPDLWLAVTVEPTGQRLLWFSGDRAQSWNQVDASSPPATSFESWDEFVRPLIRPRQSGFDLLRTNLDVVQTSPPETVSISRDLGQNWTFVPLSGSQVTVTVNVTEPDIQYAGSASQSSSLLRSNDGGQTWIPVGAPRALWRVARGSLDPDLVVATRIDTSLTEPFALEVSRDGGLSWTMIATRSQAWGYLTVAPDDTFLVAAGHVFELSDVLGTPECTANPNSTGQTAEILAVGADDAALNDVNLYAEHLPPFTFALFLVARDPGFVPGLAGGDGNLCLSGTIGRLLPVRQAGATGTVAARIDTTALPLASELVTILPGDTWRFQAWFRDGASSNLTNARAITFAL